MFRTRYFFCAAALFSLTSCGVFSGPTVENDSPVENAQAQLEVEAPGDIIYVNAPEFPSSSHDGPSPAQLYVAKGAGAIGVANAFDEHSYLQPFPGLDVKLHLDGADAQNMGVTLSAQGSPQCSSLFRFDAAASQIKIDGSKVNGLIHCELTTKVVGTANDGTQKSVGDVKTVPVTLNKTMVMYERDHDEAIECLKRKLTQRKHPKLSDVEQILSGMTSLDLSCPDDKDHKIKNLNSLTALQSLTKIDLSHTNIPDLFALSDFQKLTHLNLAQSQLDGKNLDAIHPLENIKSLNISGSNLTDFHTVLRLFPKTESLDISKNIHWKGLDNLGKLIQLKKLNASQTGLVHSSFLKGLVNLTDLDISQNNFSDVDQNDDLFVLEDMHHLEVFNVSDSHFPDGFLNSFFQTMSTNPDLNLKKFFDANTNNPAEVQNLEKCLKSENNFENIPAIQKISTLAYLDIHGNVCKPSAAGEPLGLKDVSYFSRENMPQLVYLDISNTPTQNLKGLDHTQIKTLHIFHHPLTEPFIYNDFSQYGQSDLGISMTKSSCFAELNHNSVLTKECELLGDGFEKAQEFAGGGTYDFVVPEGVYQLSIDACSGGTGGQGGQGGAGGIAAQEEPLGDPGWEVRGNTTCGHIGVCTFSGASYFTGGQNPYTRPHGFPGALGEPSGVSNLMMSDHTPAPTNYLNHCGAGSGGLGGASGGVGDDGWRGTYNFFSKFQQLVPPPFPPQGVGGAPGANMQVNTAENLAVVPGSKLTVFVGHGGAGGAALPPEMNHGCAPQEANRKIGHLLHCAANGQPGTNGGPGGDGFVRLRWKTAKPS